MNIYIFKTLVQTGDKFPVNSLNSVGFSVNIFWWQIFAILGKAFKKTLEKHVIWVYNVLLVRFFG